MTPNSAGARPDPLSSPAAITVIAGGVAATADRP